jgi:hypothetical protein
LNEDIKAAFEKAAKEYDARADAAKQQRDQELTERQQFEAGYQQKRDEVILPALRFVTTILEPHGWTCKISDSAASIKFEVFRGNMRGASTARPHTSFNGDAGSRQITIYTATQTQVVPKVTCLLTELTEEAVVKHVLEFFEKLASEPSDAGSLPTAKRARLRFLIQLLFRGGMLCFEVPSQPPGPGLLEGIVLILVTWLAGELPAMVVCRREPCVRSFGRHFRSPGYRATRPAVSLRALT